MRYANVWIAIPEDDHNELNNRRGTEDNVGPARQFVDGQLDPQQVQSMYLAHQQGQTVRHLWNIVLNDREGPFNEQINAFRQEFPGAQVLGCWNPNGTQYGTTLVQNVVSVDPYIIEETVTGTPAYEISDQLINYMPNGVLEDVVVVAGWKPRRFT
jgi:hypothetical protein